MRVIAGKFKGKKLLYPSKGVRPTSDRVKEAIFNIIGDRTVDASVLDLFSGSGALGIEALSRGAKWCDFVDKSLVAYKTIKRNIKSIGLSDSSATYIKDVFTWINIDRKKTYDLVFADPPYEWAAQDIYKLLSRLFASGILAKNALIVLEKYKKTDLSVPDGLNLVDMRKYGDTEVAFINIKSDN